MVWKKSKKSGTQKTFFGNNHMIQKKSGQDYWMENAYEIKVKSVLTK